MLTNMAYIQIQRQIILRKPVEEVKVAPIPATQKQKKVDYGFRDSS